MILIGHAGHEEVVGTMGEAPDSIVVVETIGRRRQRCRSPTSDRLAYVTQTTLSVDETGVVIAALRRRFPSIHAPKKEDICYATSNRQWAVKEMLTEIDLLLVVGSRNSSNSNRLVEVAHAGGVASYLIDDATEIDAAWLEGVSVVGVTSGASAPERLVEEVCDWFRERGVTDIAPYSLDERRRRVPPPGRAPPRARARRDAELETAGGRRGQKGLSRAPHQPRRTGSRHDRRRLPSRGRGGGACAPSPPAADR